MAAIWPENKNTAKKQKNKQTGSGPIPWSGRGAGAGRPVQARRDGSLAQRPVAGREGDREKATGKQKDASKKYGG